MFSLALLHAVLITTLALLKHRNFDTYGFDLGIYDQAWWLVGQGGGGFDTVRGFPIWGHHPNLVFVLLAPFARLGLGSWFLTVVQAGALSAGALPVFWIARKRLDSSKLGVLFAVIYLLFPPTSWLSWVSFHPESLSVTPFLFAIWFADNRHWKRFGTCVVLALSTREEVAIGMAIYGLMLVWQHRNRWIPSALRKPTVQRRSGRMVGIVTFSASVAWFFIATKVIIPRSLGGGGAYYVDKFFAGYGDSLGEVAVHLGTHPGEVFRVATTSDAIRFQSELLGPLGFLPLVSPPMALVAAPQLAITLLGSENFLREITNQYTALMIPGLIVSSIDVVARARYRWQVARPLIPKLLVGWLVLASLSGAWLRGPLPGAVGFNSWRLQAPANAVAMRSAIALIPDDAAVTASGELVPHLSHRKVIYNFPNPFTPLAYGTGAPQPDYPVQPDWVIVNRSKGKVSTVALAKVVNDPAWESVFDTDGVVVLKRR